MIYTVINLIHRTDREQLKVLRVNLPPRGFSGKTKYRKIPRQGGDGSLIVVPAKPNSLSLYSLSALLRLDL